MPVNSKTRIVIVAGQHGDEPHPALSVAELAVRWSSEPGFAELRRKSIVLIIPDANPDGLSHGTRCNSSGADLNRDWDDLSQPETRGIAHLIGQWKPHLVIDEHEVEPDRRPPQQLRGVGSAQRQARTDLDRQASKVRIVSAAFAAIDSRPGRDTSLLHRHFGNQGYLAYLVETCPRRARPENASSICGDAVACKASDIKPAGNRGVLGFRRALPSPEPNDSSGMPEDRRDVGGDRSGMRILPGARLWAEEGVEPMD